MDTQGESSTSSKFFYDAFLSFSGKDTRKTFIGHLYDRLCRDGFQIFKDDRSLRVGDVISTALEKGIEESRISIVVLSTNYGSSSWCLDELVKILECKYKLKQRVMPIFYNVLPSQVRWKTGEFGLQFAKLNERFGDERMEKWAAALTEVANLSGSELRVLTNGCESTFIGNIIQYVKNEVNHTPLHVASYPVGVDSRAKHIIESLLQNGSADEVRMVGIYGLGGIGKTTLAKTIYNRLCRDIHFDGSCFLSNVRSQEEKIGLVKVQEELLNTLFRTEEFKVRSVAEGINLIKRKLGSRKVLIVLDDVDTKNQLESLTKEKEWFGSGSIIVITTRDERLLRGLGANERYKAKLLNENESQQLFYRHAFDSLSPPQEFVGLAQDIIKYSGGLPLALVILGSHLRGGSTKEWRSDFKKLEAIPHDDIQKILKISLDGLPHDTRTVFLDIACAFHGLSEYEVTRTLNACGFYTESEIETLVQKQLLQREEKLFTQLQLLFKHDPVRDMEVHLVMHDLVRDMGREIVRTESAQYPGGRSRLFIPEEVSAVLLGNNGSGNVEVLRLEKPGELEGMDLSTVAFEPMKKLRVLEINGLRVSGDFGLFPTTLKWLSWQKCPIKSIPSNFPGANLVVLNMQESVMEEFDLNLQHCPRLKELNLSYCWSLRKTPNFIGARSLETLQIKCCSSLKDIDPSVCQLKSLQVLDISTCCSIRKLPIGLGDMQSLRSLRAITMGINQLPEFVEKLTNLETLEMGSLGSKANKSRVIESLSTSLSCLVLRDYGFSEAAFRVDIGSLSSLITLDLSGNSFCSLPFDFSKLGYLKDLRLNDCKNLHTLPSVSNLEKLEILELRNCQKLVVITGLDNLLSVKRIDMFHCNSLQNPFNEGFFSAHALSVKYLSMRNQYEYLDINLACNEIPDWCSNQVTAPSICFTMPMVHNKECKFLGMVVWFVFPFKGPSLPHGHFVVAVSDRERLRYNHMLKGHGEVSCVYYISSFTSPFAAIKGGEKITVHEYDYLFKRKDTVKKIGIHLLYSDQHGNVTSLPALFDHSYSPTPEELPAGHNRAKYRFSFFDFLFLFLFFLNVFFTF